MDIDGMKYEAARTRQDAAEADRLLESDSDAQHTRGRCGATALQEGSKTFSSAFFDRVQLHAPGSGQSTCPSDSELV